MNYYLLKITSTSVSMEIIDECPNPIYLAKRERKEHCTFKLCNSQKAVIATAMTLAVGKATEAKNTLQGVLNIITQLEESTYDRT